MFTKLAQINVNHYNHHPIGHKALYLAYCGVGAYVINKMLLKIADADTTP